ncbi:calcium-binding protein [Shimia thalassica]|uniref:calcium-binding protein n=1 Tax=Shimia thalassica TaxID=1715693 RepID=UPI0027338FB7|nr:calcium-binding protein [Shimia thalassica]MDP2493064.1 calcium-binding protein [Shimia thalassica]
MSIDVQNLFIPDTLGSETLHPWIATDVDSYQTGYDPVIYRAEFIFESYPSQIELDFASSDIRFHGFAEHLFIYNGDLNIFVLNDFETGRTLTGISSEHIDPLIPADENLYSVDTSGGWNGRISARIPTDTDITTTPFPNVTVTYLLESISFSDGVVLDVTHGVPIGGTSGNDSLYGFDPRASDGGGGNDTLEGGVGRDDLWGGEGNDTYVWSLGDGSDSILDEGGTDDQIVLHGVTPDQVLFRLISDGLEIGIYDEKISISQHFSYDYATNAFSPTYQIERLVFDDGTEIDLSEVTHFSGTSNADTLASFDFLGTTLEGLEGHDTLYGRDGNDRFIWRPGDGFDYVEGGNGQDDRLILHGVTADQISFSSEDDLLLVHVGDEFISLLYQAPALRYGASSYDEGMVESIHLDSGVRIGLEAGLEIDGTDTSDTLLGSDFAAARLSGHGGNDRLQGLDRNDRIFGGDGADTLIGGGGDDALMGGDSEDDLRDVIYGGDGDDSIEGGYGNDELRGDAGHDTIAGGFGADTVIGGTGNDTLTGSAYADQIFGGDGDDFVNGGFGHDLLNGGDGADRFFHIGVSDHGSDWVQDYNATDGDVLQVGIASATSSQFQINTTHTATAAGERSGDDDVEEAFVIYRPTGQILWALVDGGGQSSINLQIGGEVFDLMS